MNKTNNNTRTLLKQSSFTSVILEKEEIDDTPINLSNSSALNGSFTDDYLYSIELNRNKIRIDLNDYFEFKTAYEEIDFLANNSYTKQILPSIGKYIRNCFDINSKLELELMSENKDWQTLFINIYTSLDWETSNKFTDKFLENLIAFYPNIAPNLNVNIIPNEF